MPGVFLLTPGPVFQDPNQQAVQSNATLTTSGSQVFSGYGVSEVSLFINVKASPTGTTPTLQYTIQEVDPGDGTTVIGTTVSSTVINAIGIQRITLESAFGGSLKVSWTVGGGTPSFTQVYATLVGKAASIKLVDPTGTPIDASNPLRTDPTGTTPQPVSGTVTSNIGTTGGLALDATLTSGAQKAIARGGAKGTTVAGDLTSANVDANTQALHVYVAGGGGSGGTSSNFGAADPAQGTAAGFSDGTNMREARVFDADSGGGSQYVLGVGLRKTASGGSVDFGTSSDPIRTDPTGTTTQPVSGTVTAAQPTAANLNATVTQGPAAPLSGYWTVRVTDGTNTMPTGDAVGRAIYHLITDGTNTAAVTGASALKVDGSAVTQPVSGTVTSNQGTAAGAGAPWSVRLSDGAAFYDGTKTGQLPSALVGGRLDTNTGAWLGSTAPTVGSKTSANSIPIVIASDQGAIPVSQSGTWTVQQGGSPWGVKTEVELDYDTGAGTQNLSIIGLALPASGGAVAGGTGTNPIRIDPTGTTTQPVSDGGGSLTVDGTVTSNQGTAAGAGAPWSVRLSDGAAFYDGTKTGQLPTALVGGRLDANVGAWMGATTPTVGQKAMAASIPIVIASDQTALPVSQSGTWTVQQGTPPWSIVGAAADGATPSGNPVLVAGQDGTNVQSLFTDTTGRPRVVGAAASGAAVAGDPVRVAGSDGANTRDLLTDASGRQQVVGAAASGAAAAGNPVLVAGSDGTNARSLRTDTGGAAVIVPQNDVTGTIGSFGFGQSNRLRTGQETLLWHEPFDGSTVNTVRWAQSTSTMVQAQTAASLSLNSTSITTNGAYSIFTSTKTFLVSGEYPLQGRIRARVIPQTNAVNEWGFFVAATTAAPTNGAFLRVDAAGAMKAVINFNGTETASSTITALTTANYYTFEFYVYGNSFRVDIFNADGTLYNTTTVAIPVTQAGVLQLGHIPLAARVYNSGTPGAAANIILANVSIGRLDLSTAMAEEEVAGIARTAIFDPLTGSQLPNFSNSAAPTTITTGTLSNTTPAYTTLGGLFAFNTPASAETDYILFGYQVPANHTLYIRNVQISCVILGAQSTTSPTILQWGIAVGSSAASLATGAPNPPVRIPMGMQQAPKTASVGDGFNPVNVAYAPSVPLVCFSQKYVQIILRVVSGNATSGQINRGLISIDGCFV